MLLKVKLISGERLDFDISEDKFIVGRSPKCQVVIAHDGISRQHVLIEIIDGDIFVTDLASTNGVAIDGVRIQASERTRFQSFLTLSFGSVESLQISMDEQKTNAVDTNLERYNRTKDTPDQNQTSPIARQRKDEKPKGPGKFIRAKEKRDYKPIINVLVIAGLILTIYYFVSTKENDTPTPAPKAKTKNKDDDYF